MSPSISNKTLVVGVASNVDVLKTACDDCNLCDYIEIRVDTREEGRTFCKQIETMKGLQRSFLLTMRCKDDGGDCILKDEDRLVIIEDLMPEFQAIDWEIKKLDVAQNLIEKVKKNNKKFIASAHYFEHTPPLEEMLGLARRAKEAGADIVKIAFTPRSQEDVQVGADFLQRCDMPAAVMGMGSLGVESRKLYTRLGSALLYGYLGDRPAVSGQMSAGQCRELVDGD